MSQVSDDLNQILDEVSGPLRSLVNQSVLLTGGTGFVGTWLTRSWLHAAQVLRGTGRLVIVSRNPEAFVQANPFSSDRLSFIQGDIRTVNLADRGSFDLVVHAATPARSTINSSSPSEMISIIIDGQRNLIGQLRDRPRVIFTSSGAVYGPQPLGVYAVKEDQLTGPDPVNPLAAYHEGKRMAETLLAIATKEGRVDAVIARLFAFVGPFLPLDEHFAVGNFIRDGLSGGPIIVKGDGTTVRSYQYPTDMVGWLWTLAANAPVLRPYNIGSEIGMSMQAIASAVGESTGTNDIRVLGKPDPSRPLDRYVPAVSRINEDFGLVNRVDFAEALRRTVAWHRSGAK